MNESPIRTIRRGAGLTAEQLAAAAGVTSATVYRAERGEQVPTLRTLGALARVLGVPMTDLTHGLNADTSAESRGKAHEPDTADVEVGAGLAHEGA